MYSKIVVPLDGSEEAEKVLHPVLDDLLAPGGEVILLHIVKPIFLTGSGEYGFFDHLLEDVERAKWLNYLEGVRHRFGDIAELWHCVASVNGSVAERIADFAIKADADLIAMYTHDRKGLAKLIKGSIAEKVRQKAPIEVTVFKPRELVAVS